MTYAVTALLVSASVFLLAACGKPASNGADRQPAQSAPVIATVSPPSAPRPDASLAPVSVPPSAGSTSPLGRAIEQATWPPTSREKDAMRNVLIRAQVLLAQAHFSPGVIDGQPGENMKNALMAYEGANGAGSVSTFGGHAWDAGLLLQHAIPIALKKGQPGTPQFREALRVALEDTKDLPGSHGIFNMSANDHAGLDQRARVMVQIVDGKWKLASD